VKTPSYLETITSDEKQAFARAYIHILTVVLGEPNGYMHVKLWALAYELGLAAHLTTKNPSQKAKELEVTRACMSYWRVFWRGEFGTSKTIAPHEYRRPKSQTSKK
jgi:hypothetical protein